MIAGNWKSYQYLVESIRQFPAQVPNFHNLCQRPDRWHRGDPCRVSLCVLGGIQGDDRRCRFSESDLRKPVIRHRGHPLRLQTVTRHRPGAWATHRVRSRQLRIVRLVSRQHNFPLQDMCFGLMFPCDQSQRRNRFCHLISAFTRNCFLQAFSPRYRACSFCSVPAPSSAVQCVGKVKPALTLSLQCVWSFSAGSDFQKDSGSFESNDLNQKNS